MSSVPDVPRERPRLLLAPPATRSDLAVDAVELAASAGLILDPWQAFALEVILSENDAGMWSAFEVGLVVSRQNGKDAVLRALQLARLFLCEDRLIIHSAHEFKTAKEAWRQFDELLSASPDLSARVLRTVRNPSEFGFDLRSGQRLRFFARTSGSGRGWTADTLILNEAFRLAGDAMAALLPTLSASHTGNPQVVYASSAPLSDSEQLHHIRKRAVDALEGRRDGGRLAYLEWSAPEDCDPADPLAWAMANPALGHRMTLDFVKSEFDAMPLPEFRRERLSIPDEPAGSMDVIADFWPRRLDPSAAPGDPVVVAVDVAPDMTGAAIVACGSGAGDAAVIELLRAGAGTEWLPAALSDLVETTNPQRIGYVAGAPVESVLPDLPDSVRHRMRRMDGPEYQAACGAFVRDVIEGGIVHRGEPELSIAVAAAGRKFTGDAWKWSRRSSGADISSLVAATVARHMYVDSRPLSDSELLESFH